LAKQRNKALAVDEYEILDNGVIIMREEIDRYLVEAGYGKTFYGQHFFYEGTIADARRYGDEDETIDCGPNTCTEPLHHTPEGVAREIKAVKETVSGFYPKGEAVEAKRKDREEVRLGISWEG